VPLSGNLTFHQTAAITCPFYFESPSESTVDTIDFTNATALDVRFTWTPAVDVFRGAILGILTAGSHVGAPADDVRGPSPLSWDLSRDRLSPYEGQTAGLTILGPDCADNEPPAQSGVTYTQVIHYEGKITYAT
jgi:hypothetical protein